MPIRNVEWNQRYSGGLAELPLMDSHGVPAGGRQGWPATPSSMPPSATSEARSPEESVPGAGRRQFTPTGWLTRQRTVKSANESLPNYISRCDVVEVRSFSAPHRGTRLFF